VHGFHVGISPLDAKLESLTSLGQMNSKSKCCDVTMLTYKKNDVPKFGVWECDNDIKNYVRFNICSLCLHIEHICIYYLCINNYCQNLVSLKFHIKDHTTRKHGFSKGQLDQSVHIDQRVCPF